MTHRLRWIRGAAAGPTTTAKPRVAVACSDGESDEELLEDDRAVSLAKRHARPESEPGRATQTARERPLDSRLKTT